MALAKTEAVVLKSIRLRETSKIATIYTSDYGLLSVVAKGSRLPKGRFGAGLEPFTHVSIVFYRKEGRDLQYLSQLDLLEPFLPLQRDLTRFAYGSAVVEFISSVVHGEEKNRPLFDLLLESLRRVSEAGHDLLPVLLWIFELKACDILGYRPDFSRCAVCKSDCRDMPAFAPFLGGTVCEKCLSREPSAAEVHPEVITWMRRLQKAGIGKPESVAGATRWGKDIVMLLDSFLEHHIERYRGLNSMRVMESLCSPGKVYSASAETRSRRFKS